jgi:hypothetical protein
VSIGQTITIAFLSVELRIVPDLKNRNGSEFLISKVSFVVAMSRSRVTESLSSFIVVFSTDSESDLAFVCCFVDTWLQEVRTNPNMKIVSLCIYFFF